MSDSRSPTDPGGSRAPDEEPSTRDDRSLRDARGKVAASSKPTAEQGLSTRSWDERPDHLTSDLDRRSVLDCGWGRLIFGQTFDRHDDIVATVREEQQGRRDICMYAREPHVLVSRAPQELFIDPSYTYRLWLHRYEPPTRTPGLVVREMRDEQEAVAVNEIYTRAGMVTAPTETLWENQRTRTFTYLVAADADTGGIIGTVTGVDHVEAFNDPEGGTSLWCLAVDLNTSRAGVGVSLVRTLVERFKARGRAYLDLSVMHDNDAAISLYEKLGFERVPVYVVKRKNPINERLFAAPPADDLDELNPYARIIADEALRRGIGVEVLDAGWGELRLSHGGRSVDMRESLSELTSAVAMSRCDDKRVTRRILDDAGITVPRGGPATDGAADRRLLEEVGPLVVKPVRGEQGEGITVGVETPAELSAAVETARGVCPEVLLEEVVDGDDLRVVVIDHEVVAAAVRRPAQVVGDGEHTVRELISKKSRRRETATDGESSIPLDDTTEAVVADAGLGLDEVLGADRELRVRDTANLHTGGTIHDVTERLHDGLADASVAASRALDIPVVGLDLIVDDPAEPGYVMIEANERPGLANHEPQPTAQRYVDLLFPATRPLPSGWTPDPPGHDRSRSDLHARGPRTGDEADEGSRPAGPAGPPPPGGDDPPRR